MADIGTRATIVGDGELSSPDIGGPVHFTSHFRIGLRPWKKLEVGARVQHMSNAGLYDTNPGVDLLVIDVGWLL